jgi:hypothetical protein
MTNQDKELRALAEAATGGRHKSPAIALCLALLSALEGEE